MMAASQTRLGAEVSMADLLMERENTVPSGKSTTSRGRGGHVRIAKGRRRQEAVV